MSEESSSQDKQLPATQRKLNRARDEGQVVRSKDLGHFLVLAIATATLVGLTPLWAAKTQELMRTGLQFDARSAANPGVMLDRVQTWGVHALLMIVPFGLGVGIASAAASVLAGGWVMSFQVIVPKFGKLNPLTGFANLLSKQPLIDALKSSAMALVLGTAGGVILAQTWPDLVDLLAQPLPAAIAGLGQALVHVLETMLMISAGFAILDWPLQRKIFSDRMKMSHQEVKDEFKQVEGNSQVKGRMRQRMRAMARKRMLAAVPKADLVVTNPTHYAVALQYEEGRMGAPRVVAKGSDLLALKIREIATQHDVPMLEAPPLARALFASTEVDQEVPVALYSAVAQVLAYVYQLRQALSSRAPMPAHLPDLDVPQVMDPHHPSHPKYRAQPTQEETES